MTLIASDLDNTIIYSYKHNIGEDKRNVEIYEGREISFITDHTYDLLQKIQKKCLLVPITTRSIQQYHRIDLQLGEMPYALTCNGGILLENGEINREWYEYSLQLISESQGDLQKASLLLEDRQERYFEVRFIENLFVFTKCHEPEQVVSDLKKQLNREFINVFHNGDKVYAVPNKLSKGVAVERLRKLFKPNKIIAAGDSEFDVSMVQAADLGIVPHGFKKEYNIEQETIQEASGQRVFSEELLTMCLNEI